MTRPNIARNLSDVNLIGLADKYALLYETTSGLWKPGAVSQPGHSHAGGEITSVPLGGYVPVNPVVKLSDLIALNTLGDHNVYLPSYVSGMPASARAANLMLGGRWPTASGLNYTNVYPANNADTVWINLTALVANVNYFIPGIVNLTSGSITIRIAGATMSVLYLWCAGYYL